MPISKLKLLVDLKFADPDDAQNCSPTIQELIDFADGDDGYLVSGYAVTDERCDYRVSVDMIEKEGPITTNEIAEFTRRFRTADEFNADEYGLNAWWD